MGWNNYNQYMLGMLIYNSFIPRNKLEYQFIPMYGFGNNNLAGYGNIEYHILPYESVFREITFGLSGKRYAYSNASDDNFHQLEAQINFHLQKTDPKDKIKNNIIIRGILTDDLNDILQGKNSDLNTFFSLGFIHQNLLFNPYSFSVSTQTNDDFLKANIDFKIDWSYNRNKLITARLFAGTFLYTGNNYIPVYNYGLSSISGGADYTYDHLFLGRFEDPAGSNLLGKQYVSGDGGFITYAPHFTSSDWLISLNTTAAIPYLPNILDFHLYGNIAAIGTSTDYGGYENSASFAWECGLQYHFANKMIVISLPLLMSEQLKTYSNDVYEKYYDRIRFSLDLSIFNVFNIAENFLP
jgi:hypothetical protein